MSSAEAAHKLLVSSIASNLSDLQLECDRTSLDMIKDKEERIFHWDADDSR